MLESKLTWLRAGVTAAAGFSAGTAFAGIKKADKRDIAVIYSRVPAAAAGVFTLNKVKAAPVLLTMQHLANGAARAVAVNSGNANACNGEQGLQDARAMAGAAAETLGLAAEEVVVASTGVIGVKMPMEKVLPGIRAAAGAVAPENGHLAAQAIMTTDTFPKEIAAQLQLGDRRVTIGAMAKGSGMIHPNMATLLCFITTDAAIAPAYLKQALRYAVERSFNLITVDGDTSTNDMVVILANGLAANPVIDQEDSNYVAFRDALTAICISLARDIARDGEGATKLITVEVRGANTEEDARRIAKAVAGSSLVKAAIFGRDANWGRIICAAGYSGADFDPEKVDIYLGDEQVAGQGSSMDFSEERALDILSKDNVTITLELNSGQAGAVAWGCDLTYDYVKINADYRT
ncbi:MAG: bifunctional glutamate N-acetyltransferase/amino-acid acetyltransferase ArgJ [Peptococcaceae bacterium]|nr:bifunctional glutamate N-acetyltransferase/amino-acid acetyltransferase ArgJ [Peptococcaceae bacterium]